MNCKHPIYAVKCGINSEGKNIIYFPYGFKSHFVDDGHLELLPGDEVKKYHDSLNVTELWRLYGRENVITIPCGKCVACKLDYAKKWSYRCMMEASLYNDNCFLTLTYDDDHLPKDGHVHKEDLQKFMKRLRREFGEGIRFYACGEYGTLTHRPHYHLVLFNFFPPDTRPYSTSYSGLRTLVSDKIKKLWPFGNNVVGDVTPSSCAYVARYCTKKIYGNKDDSFILMSRRPGIGAKYFESHYQVIYQNDKVYMQGQTAKPSRYFDNLLLKTDPGLFEKIKNERLSKNNLAVIESMNNLSFDQFEDYTWREGELAEDKLKELKRNL